MATNVLAKLHTPFITLAFRNEMEYRYVNVHFNTANDASASCKIFVYFGLLTLQLTELSCELLA